MQSAAYTLSGRIYWAIVVPLMKLFIAVTNDKVVKFKKKKKRKKKQDVKQVKSSGSFRPVRVAAAVLIWRCGQRWTLSFNSSLTFATRQQTWQAACAGADGGWTTTFLTFARARRIIQKLLKSPLQLQMLPKCMYVCIYADGAKKQRAHLKA